MASSSKTYDVFGQTSAAFGGGFSADDAIISFSQLDILDGNTALPLLLQNLSLQYQQPISRLYDMTSNNVFLVRGRAAGRVGIGQVVGPAPLSQAFLTKYGSVCNAGKNVLDLTMQTGCVEQDASTATRYTHGYIAKYCVIESLALQVQAEQMVINQNVDMSMLALESASTPSAAAFVGDINPANAEGFA